MESKYDIPSQRIDAIMWLPDGVHVLFTRVVSGERGSVRFDLEQWQEAARTDTLAGIVRRALDAEEAR